jgi:hypothetical protein
MVGVYFMLRELVGESIYSMLLLPRLLPDFIQVILES